MRSAERLAGLAATCGALAAGEVPADYARLIARASSEGPINEAELVEAARTQDLWLGRRRRCASDAQRIALMVRDKACVGCGAEANRSFAHHIDHWKNGGGTDYPSRVFSQVKAICCNSCCNTSLTQTRRSSSPAAVGLQVGLRCNRCAQPSSRSTSEILIRALSTACRTERKAFSGTSRTAT